MLIYLCWIGLLLSGGILIYQDFKRRLLSTWLIVLFIICSVNLYLITHSVYQFIENIIFCLSYFLFCYLMLHLYFYLKTKTFQKILDSKVGWGDILLLITVGCSLEPEIMIYFFTITFSITVFAHFVLFKSKKNVPLAGYLLIVYSIYLVLEQFTETLNLQV